MKIEIWSDFACPFCYIGEKTLIKALKELNLESNTDIEYKSFQLNPNATTQKGKDINLLIAEKYGIPYDQAKASNNRIVNIAKQNDLNFDFDNIVPGNTGLAHELHKYSKTLNKDREITDVIFKAYFENGIDISDINQLIKLAVDTGINTEELKDVLSKRIFANEVSQDQNFALQNNITSVPFFVINDKCTISGAQTIEYFKEKLKEFV
ncbi:MAG: DsbA family oxidoreductase [Spirochaetales bacterium]|nr:DsbA family oxidoreductase [Spirochaetales bacterium]